MVGRSEGPDSEVIFGTNCLQFVEVQITLSYWLVLVTPKFISLVAVA